jgi:hypothetical protein
MARSSRRCFASARAGRGKAVLVGLRVLLPVAALPDVAAAEFPVLLRIVDALEEAPALLLFRQVQEELQDARAVAVQVPLEARDRPVALLPEAVAAGRFQRQVLRAQDFGVDPHDQHLFVIRAVEYAHAPALGQRARAAPEKVVVELFRARVLEAEYLAALRIDAGHDVLDDAVLAGCVHRLEDQQSAARRL